MSEELVNDIWKELLLICDASPVKDHDKVKQLAMVSKANLRRAIIAVMDKEKNTD
jgi:hypothetical protein